MLHMLCVFVPTKARRLLYARVTCYCKVLEPVCRLGTLGQYGALAINRSSADLRRRQELSVMQHDAEGT